MPRPIQVLTVREFEELVEGWTPVRRINSVHIHCTDRPRHADFRGLATIEAMRRYHMSIGMSDIAQHLTLDPRGLLWTGRPFDVMPASVRGHNGTATLGPFMIEMVGLFEKRSGERTDTFGGDQKSAAYAAVCAILRKFQLDETAVKFHREFPKTGKTCPGNDLKPAVFRADIQNALTQQSLHNFDTTVPRGLTRAPVDREAIFSGLGTEEASYLEVPEDDRALTEQEVLASWFERGLLDPSSTGASRGAAEEYRELLPHVINTSQGILSSKGKVWTTTTDLDHLIQHHLTPAFDSGKYRHLLFYAHGGLNTEEGSLEYAKAMAPWWRSYGVYPIYFIWESSLFQAIWEKPRAGGRGVGRGAGDFFDRIAEGATQNLARTIWKRMKANARRCSAPTTEFGRPGGLFELCARLEPWLAARAGQVELHAIGHSTGPILLSSFMPLLFRANRQFSSLTYLAPAIRVDDFLRDVEPHIGPDRPIRQLRQFTMNDEAERNDTVARIYRKSLLYYVREACEDQTDGRILGLEKDLYANSDLRQLFGLKPKAGDLRASSPVGARATVEFSQDAEQFEQNERTKATQHGAFDNDRATMSTVLARILGRQDLVGVPEGHSFPEESRREGSGGGPSGLVAESDEDFEENAACCCCGCRRDEKRSEDDAFDESFELGAPTPVAQGGPATSSSPASNGRRIALCVGINDYPRQPLAGCVQDSKNWAAALRRNGFDVRLLHDKEATRANLMSGLRDLIREGRAGDHLVFQFAGHGTQVDDLSRDESDQYDEVLVPVDFDKGALWIDDDLYELTKDLRGSGATLTFLMDCCHSGTNTRFAPTVSASRGAGPRPRYLRLSGTEIEAHKRSRKRARNVPPVSERDPIPGVVSFAACRDNEVAWEEAGQGNFSRHSLSVFDEVLRGGGSNADFIEAVIRAFGGDTRQRPLLLKPAPGLEQARFLGSR